ncbi:MAG: autotransporter-associated beta strand repeat-containing protein, partial [Verrucomicrobia bacterium]|nr:autotransporter-associated beta strand repeat-containing protein [Verrucomicrobiota bacterium]
MKCYIILLFSCFLLDAQAQSVWQGGVANNWTTATNWNPNGVPGETVNSAVFNGGGNPSVIVNPSTPNTTLNLSQISFTGAVPYNVQLTNGVNMVLNAQGIVNQSAAPQTFTIPDTTVHFEFANGSTIVGNVILNSAAHLKFGNTSDAGSATFNNTSTDFTFDDFSTADRATINNKGSLGFLVGASAANSVINNSGLLFFFPLATHAANATINNSGTVDFFQMASGDNAKFFSSGGTLNIVNLTSKGTTIGFITGSGLVELGAENLNLVGASDHSTFNSLLSATITGVGGSLTMSSAGSLLTMTGTNTYTGGTFLDAGTVSVSRDNNLGDPSGGLTFNGGTLETTASFATARAITLNTAATIINDGSTTLTVASSILGSGALVKGGPGALLLVNNNSYTGGTTIASGVLQLGNGGNTGSIIGNIVDNGNLVFNRIDRIGFNGVISGTGILTQLGPGSLTLTGANSYSGGTILDAGILSVSSDSNLGAPSGGLTFNGGALENTASFVTGRP